MLINGADDCLQLPPVLAAVFVTDSCDWSSPLRARGGPGCEPSDKLVICQRHRVRVEGEEWWSWGMGCEEWDNTRAKLESFARNVYTYFSGPANWSPLLGVQL